MEKTESGEKLVSITQIWERLFLGGLLDAERLARANPLGITTVISLSETQPCAVLPEIKYVHFPIEEAQEIPIDRIFVITNAISKNIRCGRVLIHCGSGISRAPLMVAAYLHVVGYKNFDAALKEIAVLRPFIAPWASVIASMRERLR
jgi:protein tyrosine/serine phosphatase